MSKRKKKPKIDTAPSVVTLAMNLRGGSGIHADQRRRVDPKVIRKDKSYKDER